jgi:orotate phosphoribosyltransferase
MAMSTSPSLEQRLRALLLDRSIARGDFTLASGRRSSFYIDARRTTMSGEGLHVIGALALERLATRGWTPRLVGGLTLGADPVAYAIAAAGRGRGGGEGGRGGGGRELDAFTVRQQAKTHGTGKRIEGCFAPGAPVVVVEDVITTGRSALEAIRAVESEGGRVLGVLAVVDREEGGREALEQAGYQVEALVTASELGLR